MDRKQLTDRIADTLFEPSPDALPGARSHQRGKVRDIWDLGNRLLILTSDRVSAFDRVLTTIPCKGEILNRIALYWFEQTADIIPNHVLKSPSARSVLVRHCEVVPIEVVVRGYLVGSAWRDYSKSGAVSGLVLPAGMAEYQRFEEPLLTPSTKESEGHDRPISSKAIVEEGIVAAELWRAIEQTALALFRRGQDVAGRNGMILVDTKYEFGLADGELLLIDEVHTPDSSRFWYADDLVSGQPPRQLDKEYLRRWLMDQGFMGDGDPPPIPEDVRVETALRYVEAFQRITGTTFEPESTAPEVEIAALCDAAAG